MRRISSMITYRLALAAFAATMVGGCSMDDVELNGGVFDAVGIGANQPKSAEPKLAAHTPLVVPPSTASLPQPGIPAQAAAIDVTAAINDPDRKAVVSQAEKERAQQEYCDKNYRPAVAVGDASADSIEGPLGPCRPSILNSMKKWNGGEDPLVIGGQ